MQRQGDAHKCVFKGVWAASGAAGGEGGVVDDTVLAFELVPSHTDSARVARELT